MCLCLRKIKAIRFYFVFISISEMDAIYLGVYLNLYAPPNLFIETPCQGGETDRISHGNVF
jgi:hypothetical protein